MPPSMMIALRRAAAQHRRRGRCRVSASPKTLPRRATAGFFGAPAVLGFRRIHKIRKSAERCPYGRRLLADFSDICSNLSAIDIPLFAESMERPRPGKRKKGGSGPLLIVKCKWLVHSTRAEHPFRHDFIRLRITKRSDIWQGDKCDLSLRGWTPNKRPTAGAGLRRCLKFVSWLATRYCAKCAGAGVQTRSTK